jgi:hypothetical protein
MTTRKPTAPRDLGTSGRAFWRKAVAAFGVSEVEPELLLESCRLIDECETLRTAVDTEGITVAGSTDEGASGAR